MVSRRDKDRNTGGEGKDKGYQKDSTYRASTSAVARLSIIIDQACNALDTTDLGEADVDEKLGTTLHCTFRGSVSTRG